jgi:hypothetical protein
VTTKTGLGLAWHPGPPATDEANAPIAYGSDPHGPGGVDWAIRCADAAIETLEAMLADARADRAHALASKGVAR